MFTARKSHLALIVGLALALRLVVFRMLPPLMYPDSFKYLAQAEQYLRGDWGADSGLAPGYPLVLAAFGGHVQAVTVFQLLAGLAVCVLLYFIFGRLSGRASVALAGALTYALSPFQAVFERVVTTESLSTFLVALAILFLSRVWEGTDRRRDWLLLGLAASLAAALRPLMQFLPLLLAALAVLSYLQHEGRARLLAAAGRAALAVLPAVIIIGGWSAFNYERSGYFGLTTLAGFHLTNQSGDFMEQAPPEYSDIASIYLKHRKEMLARKGSFGNTIWSALPELESTTGLSRAELSKRFARLSRKLILDNPRPYLRRVAKGFLIFWLPCWYNGEQTLVPTLRSGPPAERLLLWPLTLAQALLTGLYFLLPVGLALSSRLRRAVTPGWPLAGLYLLVLATAVLSALVEYGSNDRFEQPVEPYVLGIGLYMILSLAALRKSPGSPAGQSGG